MDDAPASERLQALAARRSRRATDRAAHRAADDDRDPTELSTRATTAWVTETHFRAMGSDAHLVLVDADPRLLEDAREHLELLEARWSRFRASSELSALNARPGRPVVVSEDTCALIARAVGAWHATRGRFDPTILPALRVAGCDRDFATVVVDDDGAIATAPRAPMPALGCAGIVVDAPARAVTLPDGVTLDLGGIGMGYAADLLAASLLRAGARGACVNLGGDLRVAGKPPEGDAWTVEVDDPFRRGTGSIDVVSGAVATSSRLRRAWRRRGRDEHHRVEPATGRPARTGLASVTVVAVEAWWAEVLAKAAFVAGPIEGARVVTGAGATGLFVYDDGRVEDLPGLDAFRRA